MNKFDQAILLNLICADKTLRYEEDLRSIEKLEAIIDEYFDKHILPEEMDPLLK